MSMEFRCSISSSESKSFRNVSDIDSPSLPREAMASLTVASVQSPYSIDAELIAVNLAPSSGRSVLHVVASKSYPMNPTTRMDSLHLSAALLPSSTWVGIDWNLIQSTPQSLGSNVMVYASRCTSSLLISMPIVSPIDVGSCIMLNCSSSSSPPSSPLSSSSVFVDVLASLRTALGHLHLFLLVVSPLRDAASALDDASELCLLSGVACIVADIWSPSILSLKGEQVKASSAAVSAAAVSAPCTIITRW
mmetsp:Transcript_6526/g.14318  ORF Transcript_6526/g.14318 Transcript_6526/m.14318 type:complete len:249 (+) Transcript_6526:1398-2144(+)